MWVALNSWYPVDGDFLRSPSNFIFFCDDDNDARADAPVSCAAIRHALVNGEHEKTHKAKRCACSAREPHAAIEWEEHSSSRASLLAALDQQCGVANGNEIVVAASADRERAIA